MSSMGRAPVRHPAPELPEDALRSTTELEGTPQGGEHMLAYMRLLWEHRRMLARVTLYGVLSSAAPRVSHPESLSVYGAYHASRQQSIGGARNGGGGALRWCGRLRKYAPMRCLV